jgi:hypothetical protein
MNQSRAKIFGTATPLQKKPAANANWIGHFTRVDTENEAGQSKPKSQAEVFHFGRPSLAIQRLNGITGRRKSAGGGGRRSHTGIDGFGTDGFRRVHRSGRC